ncbi:MAG: hypothetical protein ABWX92_11050 [Mycetocola sp.]
MALAVLIAWAVQAAIGVTLLAGWARHGRRSSSTVLTHAAVGILGLAAWTAYVILDALLLAWIAFVIINVGQVLGDALMMRRHRRVSGVAEGRRREFVAAVSAVVRGKLHWTVTLHIVFGGVALYFSCLAVCIGATVSAAS